MQTAVRDLIGHVISYSVSEFEEMKGYLVSE